MAFQQKTDGVVEGGHIRFHVWDDTRQTVLVLVTQEALEDYAHPRGFGGDIDTLFRFALEDVLYTAERVYNRERTKPREIIVRTTDLNR